MKTPGQRFLTEDEKAIIAGAVRRTEMLTSGEIVPMIVSASSTYPQARIVAALCGSLPTALLCSHLPARMFWLDHTNVYLFFTLALPLYFFFSFIISRFPLLARPFITRDDMEEEVREEAVKSFFRERLYRTRDANGILLFISVFERKVWILADHGIEEKVAPETWLKIVDHLTAGIRRKNRCQAIVQSIEEIGAILKEHFPHRKNDTDELHNLIIR